NRRRRARDAVATHVLGGEVAEAERHMERHPEREHQHHEERHGGGHEALPGHFIAASSASPFHGAPCAAMSARALAPTCAFTAPPVLPHCERRCVASAAISSSFSWSLNAGIAPLYAVPFTVSDPVTPFSRIFASTSSLPVTHSEPASGGNTPGKPAP